MRLTDILTTDQIILPLTAADRDGAIKELIDLLSKKETISDPEQAFEAVLEREKIMTTGVGNGIAIPHCKHGSCPNFSVVMGIHSKGIPFESVDKKDVKIIGYMENAAQARSAITLDHLIDAVVEYFTVTKSDVIGVSRTRDCIIPRQVIMYLAKTRLRMSFAKIGQIMGNRNHATVMHSITKISKQIKNDRQLLRDVNAISEDIGMA